jgi:hypothetical protein
MEILDVVIDNLEHRLWCFASIKRIECFNQAIIIATSVADV